jgi:glucan phosphoethanolaminetransferase (alkaline phosphatase superfamily)
MISKTEKEKKLRNYVGICLSMLIVLNFPVWHVDWGWRLALMSFVPSTLIFAIFLHFLGYEWKYVSNLPLRAIFIMTILSLPAAVYQVSSFQSTITTQQYNDLVAMRPYLANSTLPVVMTDNDNIIYWLDYLGHVTEIGIIPSPPYLYVTRHIPTAGNMIYRGQNLTLTLVK